MVLILFELNQKNISGGYQHFTCIPKLSFDASPRYELVGDLHRLLDLVCCIVVVMVQTLAVVAKFSLLYSSCDSSDTCISCHVQHV